MVCVQCGSEFRAREKKAKYCSRRCNNEFQKLRVAKIRPATPYDGYTVTPATTGAASELIVAVDLMRRGLHVFRALSPSCPCDLLVLMPDGLIQRIEVRTTQRNLRGDIGLRFGPKDHGKSDVVAMVVATDGTIEYRPDFLSMHLSLHGTSHLAVNQEPLPEEAQRVLHENAWDLYE